MIELIAGGARSGKSTYALKAAEAKSGNKVFVATATADDDEMKERIIRHQAQRNRDWRLVEQPQYLAKVVEQFGSADVLLIDCLTLWLSNWLCSERYDQWEREKQQFLRALTDTEAEVLLVTNEVGMGVVSANQLSRQFVDQSGWLHQDIAAVADRVTMIMFGLPYCLKGEGGG
ncbi:MAG: bifunctional adenosylcobinamide kinase/adenosylcobinamide-phosphate guanylyltransferase [Arenicellales bacterium]